MFVNKPFTYLTCAYLKKVNMEVFYKLKVAFWVCVARQAQSRLIAKIMDLRDLRQISPLMLSEFERII